MRGIAPYFLGLALASGSLITWGQPLNTAIIVQAKYAPWGIVSDIEPDAHDNTAADYSQYNMHFQHSLGGRLIVEPFYISVQENITELNSEVPDVRLRTYALGMAGITFDPFDNGAQNLYLIGSLGLGKGFFDFKTRDNDWEFMIDGNAELGLRLAPNLIAGLGIDWQHFANFWDSKANYWNFYISAGLVFD